MSESDMSEVGSYLLEEHYVRKSTFSIYLKSRWDFLGNEIPGAPDAEYMLNVAGDGWFAYATFNAEKKEDLVVVFRDLADSIEKLAQKEKKHESTN